MSRFNAMTAHRRIRCAVVGCGRVAQKHFRAIANFSKELELVAICDSDPDVLYATQSAAGVPGYGDLIGLLGDVSPDVVILCSPSALHPTQAIQALGARCHVLTEKPMATTWEDALTMVNAFEAAPERLFVVKQMRYQPTLRWVKDLLDARRLGRIYMVQGNVFWTRPQSYYDEAAWRGTWALDGGALINQASHYVDLMSWLFGPVQSVQAYTGTLGRAIEVEDSAVLNLRWRSGTLGAMSVSMLTYPKNFEASLSLIGERGTIRLSGPTCNRIAYCELDGDIPDEDEIARVHEQTLAFQSRAHYPVYQNLIDVLRGYGDSFTDGREGLKSLEVIIAAYRSAREGKNISLPLEGNEESTWL